MDKHTLPKLSYKYDALEPYIDAKTMEIHHTKHHQTYIDKLNAALDKHPELYKKDVGELLGDINKVPEDIRTAVRNHGGGHLNHSFFWKILSGNKKDNEFKGEIVDMIIKKFGSFDEFKKRFVEAGMNRFGSGWAWLVINNGELEIINTANQDSPLMEGKMPILGVDVWEHAYYVKHLWNRKAYLEDIWNIINWKQVNENYRNDIEK